MTRDCRPAAGPCPASSLPVTRAASVAHRAPSRRGLENRFRRTFGRGLHAEITRRRVERAKTLLTETDLYTPDIAAECAWPSASHFSVVFKRWTGSAPTAYRREHAPSFTVRP